MSGRSRATSPADGRRRRTATFLAVLVACAGCAVGPSYHAPPAPTAKDWLNTDDSRVKHDAPPARWWTRFEDPVLTRLVETAYARNPTLEAAGLRVLQAQARRGIAIGQLFPQTQEVVGSYTHSTLSSNVSFGSATIATTTPGSTFPAIDVWQLGAEAAWEIDLWGRYRRGIEAASADVLASLASYDDVLVSLVAQVASEYVAVRVLEERLLIARDNVRTQQESLDIASIRFEAGGTSNLDVQQALTLLRDTEATIPQLEAQLQQATNVLSVLLGLPPQELGDLIGEPGRIPTPPATIAVGIPAELVWRRPDVRAAERAAAAQSARIGVAFADLLPRVELVGTVGLSADDAARLFEGRSFTGSAGPSFEWPVLNYGRIINNVRVQDATFQELVARWIDTVLRAQQEVEDAIAGYLGGIEGVKRLEGSVTAADRAVELSTIQYREGAADFTRVLNSQQQKLREDDLLAQTRGQVASSVIGLYRALGGGWELRDGRDVVPRAVKREMRRRTWWGWMLGHEPGPGDARVEEQR